jgi:hypothetical protein
MASAMKAWTESHPLVLTPAAKPVKAPGSLIERHKRAELPHCNNPFVLTPHKSNYVLLISCSGPLIQTRLRWMRTDSAAWR